MFYLKFSGSVFITAYAFGVAIATVTVLLCGSFVVLSRKNWLQTIFESYCFQVQSKEAPYLLSLATVFGIFKLSTHGGFRASLSAFSDISFLTSFLNTSPLNTRVHTQYEEKVEACLLG